MNKRERFEKIAVARTNRLLEGLRLLGNCANRNNYSYSEKDISKIFNAIESELKTTKSKFIRTNREKDIFTL
jgi:hypothetical protein